MSQGRTETRVFYEELGSHNTWFPRSINPAEQSHPPDDLANKLRRSKGVRNVRHMERTVTEWTEITEPTLFTEAAS